MSKRDDINELYQPSKKLGLICTLLFWMDIVLSIVSVFADSQASSVITVLLIVVAFLYMTVSVFDDGVLWFRAESARRKNSIQSAFDVRLDEYETEGYYNNGFDDPELAYAVNTLESVFFTNKIVTKMLPGAIIKLLFAVVALITSIRLISNDALLLIVAQAAFSTIVAEYAIRMIIFALRIKSLYDKAYLEFVTFGISNYSQIVWLRYFCIEYESIKAHYRVQLSESLFEKMNPDLSEEWSALYEQIQVLRD